MKFMTKSKVLGHDVSHLYFFINILDFENFIDCPIHPIQNI